MGAKTPRVVVVVRETEYELLLARHATHAQAGFFLTSRGQSIEDVQGRHARFQTALQKVTSSIPGRWRRTRVLRRDLATFLFEPEDIVLIVGQDGLVANVAKYLDGQPVIGINPMPDVYDGVLVPFGPGAVSDLLSGVVRGKVGTASRTMVEASLDDGQRLLALNEIFVGVRTHQSARYRIRFADQEERQSSSGLIVATGTGATGWALSVSRERRSLVELPGPGSDELAFFVREAFPSVATGVDVTEGLVGNGRELSVVSEMNEGGVIFGDGIEDDGVVFPWGSEVLLRPAGRKLNWVRDG